MRKESPYKDVNGNPIFEGDTVKGVGKHVGQSEVLFKHGVWQPFDYLNDYDGKNYEIVSVENAPKNSQDAPNSQDLGTDGTRVWER